MTEWLNWSEQSCMIPGEWTRETNAACLTLTFRSHPPPQEDPRCSHCLSQPAPICPSSIPKPLFGGWGRGKKAPGDKPDRTGSYLNWKMWRNEARWQGNQAPGEANAGGGQEGGPPALLPWWACSSVPLIHPLQQSLLLRPAGGSLT